MLNTKSNYDFLDNVFLQKTPFKIIDKNVEQGEEHPFQPKKFYASIRDFESGQVYEVLMKNDQGSYANLNHNNELAFADRVAMANSNSEEQKYLDKSDNFLIYIIN